MTDEADRIRRLLESDDERTRAVAARSVCVCHGSFDLFSELRDDLERLVAGDDSARVRREAKHMLRDPLVVNRHDEERLEFGHRELGVEEVLAGVTHGNDKSVAVLTRLGFAPVADFDTYTRFGKTFD